MCSSIKRIILLMIFLLCVLFVRPNLASYSLSPELESLIDRGFVNESIVSGVGKVILGRNKLTETCVYGETPNAVVKKNVNSFFGLLNREYSGFHKLMFVKNLKDCPINTSFYIYVHDSYSEREFMHKNNEYAKVLIHSGIKLNESLKKKIYNINFIAFTGWLVDYVERDNKKKLITYIALNQMSHFKNSVNEGLISDLLKTMIIQELFQAITMGRDIDKKSKLYSLLHESTKNTGALFNMLSKDIGEYLVNNPNGLCGYDIRIMNLIFSYPERIYSYKKYEKRLKSDYQTIIKNGISIENNPLYKDLFDPRCSGKNSGLNTKIGIE